MRVWARSSSPSSTCDIISRWRNRYNGQTSDNEWTASQIGKDTGQLIEVVQLLKTGQDNINKPNELLRLHKQTTYTKATGTGITSF